MCDGRSLNLAQVDQTIKSVSSVTRDLMITNVFRIQKKSVISNNESFGYGPASSHRHTLTIPIPILVVTVLSPLHSCTSHWFSFFHIVTLVP